MKSNPRVYNRFIKRGLDVIAAFVGLVFLSPIIFIVTIILTISFKGKPFYVQERVGYLGKNFHIYKFKSMRDTVSSNEVEVTASNNSRVTKIGRIIRKAKIDELPQLLNVIKGDMALVGPRPEVSRFTRMNDKDRQLILTVRPGITSLTSINFIDEENILSLSSDVENTYIEEILPQKMKMDVEYVESMSFILDMKIIILTILKILRR